MISITLNCRGVANSSKKLALKRLIDVNNPSIIFLRINDGVGETC